MTFGGFIDLVDKLGNVDLDKNKTVNPFIYMHLKQVKFAAVLV